jgi:hypothetical protein
MLVNCSVEMDADPLHYRVRAGPILEVGDWPSVLTRVGGLVHGTRGGGLFHCSRGVMEPLSIVLYIEVDTGPMCYRGGR